MSVKIFIVDTGIDDGHPEFKNKNIEKFGIQAGTKNLNYKDDFGHGTAIASIILRDIANKSNIEIVVVKIFTSEMRVNEYHLVTALQYLSENCNPDVINLSLGLNICEDINGLQSICKKITDKGTIIVSAFDNSGAISYPAAFENVIGVATGFECYKTCDFEFYDDTVVNIAAKGNIQRIAWTYPSYIMLGGNSFACAHVSAKVAEFIAQGIRGREAILNEFQKIAKSNHRSLTPNNTNLPLFTIKNAALFPFNKEMHSIIRFSESLSFNIVGVYDTKYSSMVGATTSHLMRDSRVKSLAIKNIESIDWDEIDTLIIGHTDSLASLINKEQLRISLVEKALKRGKNIFSFDDLEKFGYTNSENIYFPKVKEEDLPPEHLGMLYRISKPVVGIFGTSSKQGKFTLQLKLRELLKERGYSVGQMGTEPTSPLFGMNSVFPMGYNSSVYIKNFDVIRFLNSKMHEMCQMEHDIIIVGCQSGTVTYDTGNAFQYPIMQYSFLLGTQPDAIIICVNPYDDKDYIKRTINFIEASVIGKVIAAVVFPMTVSDNWSGLYGSKSKLDCEEYDRIRIDLKNKLGIPIYNLDDESNMNNLTELIIKFF